MLPPPPSAQQIDLPWLLANKAVVAEYMRTVYALANCQVFVTADGKRSRAASVAFAGTTSSLEIVLPSTSQS